MIKVYAIKSILSKSDESVTKESLKLLNDLKELTREEFVLVDSPKDLKGSGLSLILVQTGGSEGFFKKDIYPVFEGPYYLLTYGSSNSLAASLEIHSFIKNNAKKGEVLHGDNSYIANRIKELSKVSKEVTYRLGVLGIPSDWLISSEVDYKKCKDIFNIELVDVLEDEIIEAIKKHNSKAPYNTFKAKYKEEELDKAYNIYLGLKDIVTKYQLDGFTLRCFDILGAVHSSSCSALALFNDEGITARCEGDIPSLITMFILQNKFHSQSFQANPNWIDPEKNEITLAHCTLPLKMTKGYTFDTHFESGIGLGIHGELDLSDVTIVKISSNLELFYVEEGAIIKNEYRQDRCRTQIVIRLNGDAAYFLTSSLGNHHLVIYGKRKKEIQVYLRSLGLREVI
jgi:L-fucose isomerase-like protein